jgi:hypothetical protein
LKKLGKHAMVVHVFTTVKCIQPERKKNLNSKEVARVENTGGGSGVDRR